MLVAYNMMANGDADSTQSNAQNILTFYSASGDVNSIISSVSHLIFNEFVVEFCTMYTKPDELCIQL